MVGSLLRAAGGRLCRKEEGLGECVPEDSRDKKKEGKEINCSQEGGLDLRSWRRVATL